MSSVACSVEAEIFRHTIVFEDVESTRLSKKVLLLSMQGAEER
jgi:hypothetical protein